MRVFDRIASNAFVLLLSRLFQKLMGFIALWFLVRLMSPSDFGLYSFVLVWIATASAFTDMGTSSGAVRLWSEDSVRMAKLLPKLFLLRTVFVIIGAVISVVIWILFYPQLSHWCLIFVCLGIILQFYSVAWTPFQAELNNMPPFIWSAVNRILVVSVLILALIMKAKLPIILAIEILLPIFLIAKLIKESMAIAKQKIRSGEDVPSFEISRIFSDVLPLGIWNILTILYFRIDVFMLMKMTGERFVAEYSAGFRLIEPLLTLPGVLGASIMPIVVSRWTGMDKEGALRSVDRASRIMPLTMTLIALPLSVFSEEIIGALFGVTYRNSANVMSLIAWTLPLSGWSYAWSSLILAERKYRYNNLLAFLALIVNFIGNLWAIPRYGITGAAVMTVGTELIWSIGTCAPFAKTHSPLLKNFASHMAVIVLGISIAGTHFGNLTLTHRIILLFIALFSMTALARILKLFNSDDIKGIMLFLKRVKK